MNSRDATEGEASKLYQSWSRQLIRSVAHIEAYIDFAEDENIESDVLANSKASVCLFVSFCFFLFLSFLLSLFLCFFVSFFLCFFVSLFLSFFLSSLSFNLFF